MAMKRLTILISCCAIAAPAVALAAGQAPAQTPSGGGAGASAPAAAQHAASRKLVRAYVRWRHRLHRYGAWTGRNLIRAAAADGPPTAPTAAELRRSIHRMQKRFHAYLRTPHGRATKFRLKGRHIPSWGRQELRSIAACESHGNPRAIGGGGAYRGMYQFSF